MTAPLPLISQSIAALSASAGSASPSAGNARNAMTDKNGASFADLLSKQGANPKTDLRSLASAGNQVVDGQQLADTTAQDAATLAEAGALAVAAQQIVTATALPEQALALAAQAAGQVGAPALAADTAAAIRGQAQAAINVASGASVLSAALSAAASATPAVAAQPLTADQAAALAANAAQQADAETPVLTTAVKSTAPTIERKTDTVAKNAPELRLTPAIDVPARGSHENIAAPLQAENNIDVDALPAATSHVTATAQQASTAMADQASNFANAMLNAAAQRQPIPVSNPATLAPPVPIALQIATPVGGTHWGTELGQQLVAMGTNSRTGMHSAELRLDPPDLGPLRVSLNLADGIASASFVSAHASVRQAIEAAIPQLQQSLAQAGISLGQTSVGEQSAQQEFGARQQGNGSQRQGNGEQVAGASVELTTAQTNVARASNALVDTFA